MREKLTMLQACGRQYIQTNLNSFRVELLNEEYKTYLCSPNDYPNFPVQPMRYTPPLLEGERLYHIWADTMPEYPSEWSEEKIYLRDSTVSCVFATTNYSTEQLATFADKGTIQGMHFFNDTVPIQQRRLVYRPRNGGFVYIDLNWKSCSIL